MKDIKGYEGLYSVTKDGRVWSHPKKYKGGHNMGKFLKINTDTKGYGIVNLGNNGTYKTKKVHRLVGLAFIKNNENKPQINHKDGNKKNNNVNNLEWCTNSENQIHAWENGLNTQTEKRGITSANNLLKARKVATGKNRKLSIDDASEVCEAYATGIFTQSEIANNFGVAVNVINRIVNGVGYVA